MHTLPSHDNGSAPGRHSRWAIRVLAALVMSLGIGFTTAAFTMATAVLPHAATTPSCDITVAYAPDNTSVMRDVEYEAPELGDRVSDAYDASMNVANDGLESTLEAVGDGAGTAVVLLAGAAALALLVACARTARRMYDGSGGALDRAGLARAAAMTAGAVAVATILLRAASSSAFADLADAMPTLHLDARAVAFAVCVSALVELRRRMAARLTSPTKAGPSGHFDCGAVPRAEH